MSIIIGKLATFSSRKLGNRGSDIAGKVALKINPNTTKKLAKNIDKIILVTGTNGKTTTTNLIANALSKTNKKYLHNKEGANLVTGITSCMINNYQLFKQNKYDYAIFEVDEGSMPKAIENLKPDYVVVTNFFRDQLDRYAEIDLLIEKIKKPLNKSKETTLVLNSDDPFCLRFNQDKQIGYGLSSEVNNFKQVSVSDSKFCPVCQEELEYDTSFYGQLGHYHCCCGFKRLDTTYELSHIKDFEVCINNTIYTHNLNGDYNAYNVLAATALLKLLNIEDDLIKEGLSTYNSDDGRMQKLNFNNNDIYLNLVKNPAGMNMSLQEVEKLDLEHIMFVLNDNEADGLDISWIWDADFELLLNTTIKKFYCSGLRAYDMAIRLKNMGISIDDIIINEDIDKTLDLALTKSCIVLSSYTALNTTKLLIEKKVK